VGVTVLIATHDIHLIDRLGFRKIILEQGVVIDSGGNDSGP
jgi:ABC-type ATPase involved in cell division